MDTPQSPPGASSTAIKGEKKKRGSSRGHRRFSAIPPMPTDARRELDLLGDHAGPLGFLLWRILSDVLLWNGCPPEDRRALFHPAPEDETRRPACAILAAPELRDPLRVMLAVSSMPELADAAAVADACAAVAEWAEAQGMKETAVQFAEAAARIEPGVSRRAYTPGRLCRRLGAYPRAAMWYWRAVRLARVANRRGVKGSEIDFSNAHLGLGNLEFDLGNFEQAERHYWKAVHAALRVGRKSLAGAAHHNLMHLMTASKRLELAQGHAQQAVSCYPGDHPRFPLLAHDIGVLWLWQGYFSSALRIFEKVLPWVEHQRERILVLASLARSAAAVKDHIRYQRAATEVIAMAAVDNELADSSLYYLAEGARSFLDWERAERLAAHALQLAQERENSSVSMLAQSLLDAVAARQEGDVDRIPPEDGEIDQMAALILKKIQKQPAPELSSGAVSPERYPTE